ncbi:MAG TPA: nucleotide disphospho-sugar-binding domain-containing protein [Terracidiphilus sp.]|jgi:MGT family glycosyltransferase
MARFLFTMLPANDLGLPTRMVPIARALADRGHEVAVFNPSPAPQKLIAEAGLTSLPMPATPMPEPAFDLTSLAGGWDAEHFFAGIYTNEDFVRRAVAAYVDLVADYMPDMVVDSFEPIACLAARIARTPLATVLQGNIHPASRGFTWWEDTRPPGLPSAAAFFSTVAQEHGLAPVSRVVDLLAGDLALIVGTPETDPVGPGADATYIGPMVFQRRDATLPEWVKELGGKNGPGGKRPLIWVYSGNPRYFATAGPCDSIVVIRAAIAALAEEPVDVVLTTGYQELPKEFGALPKNFHHTSYVPGPLMAERCDLIVFHGGHSSVMTCLNAGTPAVIIPTITERESNARRLASLGAGEVVMPVNCADGEKRLDLAEFSAKVKRVLNEPHYRESATRIAESMRQFGGPATAADRLEKFAMAPARQQATTAS